MHNEAGYLSEDAHALQLALMRASKDEAYDCDLLVVGSGYGGAVAAARFAASQFEGKPLRVMVVERGREYLAGMFPSRFGELAGHVRFSQQDGARPRGNDTALWDLRLGKHVNVVLASGLGGGSLVNAAVMERPEAEVWASGWPAGIDAARLAPAYSEVERMLQTAPLPAEREFEKLRALQRLGGELPGKPEVKRCQLAVSFEDQRTPDAGVEQKACTACGDCATGCNQGAKNSLDRNYLALAKRYPATKFYCGVLATRIESDRTGWCLHWTPMAHRLPWATKTAPIRARWLIICAGSLGSTELLQRSQGAQLRLSSRLGKSFSANGDMIAAVTELPQSCGVCGDESSPAGELAQSRNIGPTITGMLRYGEGLKRFTLQEFAIPAPLRRVLGEATASFGMLQGMAKFDWGLHWPGAAQEDPLAAGEEALARTMVYGLMGNDGARGRLMQVGESALPGQPEWDGRIAIQWPGAAREAVFDSQHEAFSAAYAQAGSGRYIPNPLWRPLPPVLDDLVRGQGVRGSITTVHPLGGCAMADRPELGVVDHLGRVFNTDSGVTAGTVHEGLVVLDGAILPRALGINPALTIAALAEHAVPELMRHWGLRPQAEANLRTLPPRPVWRTPPPRPTRPNTRIRLREQMEGPVEFAGQRYWAELRIRFAPSPELVSWVARLPRTAPIEVAELRLYPDRGTQEDDAQWRSLERQRPPPLWRVSLSGQAQLLFRHWSWWPDRVWRGGLDMLRSNTATSGKPLALLWEALLRRFKSDGGLRLGDALAVASNVGERRGMDYQLQVQGPCAPACPLQLGDRLLGRKVLDSRASANPWRQLSEMELQWRPNTGWSSWRAAGRLALDLRYVVRRGSSFVSLYSQLDQSTALVDLSALLLFALRAALKMQLMSFVPPAKPLREHDTPLRQAGELPGLCLRRYDLREQRVPVSATLTNYFSATHSRQGLPVLLIHGLTASGSSFAHPSIEPNLVQSLCRQRRDVWVVDLRTSIAFEKREAQDWTFEDVAEDIPGIVDAVLSKTRAKKVDVIAHCIGSAMFCRAVLNSKSDLHSKIGAAVLSQVGPVLYLSPANHLRGYLASYLAQYLGTSTLDAKPEFGSGAESGLGQTLIDVLLASLPYPDRDRERTMARLAVAQGRPDFRLVRHRSDAMLGRLMELSGDSNLSEATLDSLDEQFGFTRVKTLAHVIHYARHAMLVDSDGRNREIGQANLATLAFPILLLHGRLSGVFDWRGSLASYRWLCSSYAYPKQLQAGRTQCDVHKQQLGVGTPRQLCLFEKMGHQDCIIGSAAPALVFPVISEFLRSWSPGAAQGVATGGKCPEAQQQSRPPWVARLPWLGPVVGWVRPSATGQQQGRLDVNLLLHPNPAYTATRCILIIPMQLENGYWRPRPQQRWRFWRRLKGPPEDGVRLARPPMAGAPVRDLGEALRLDSVTLSVCPGEVDGLNTALLFLMIHSDLPRQGDLGHHGGNGPLPAATDPDKRQASLAALRLLADPTLDLEPALLRLSEHVLAAQDLALEVRPPAVRPREVKPGSDSLTLVVASCQYPNGLLDRELAMASYARLQARLDAAPSGTQSLKPQLLLLLGDQIYADESAGMFEPSPAGGAVAQAYERNFGQPEFRAVTSRLPTYMLLDDHEVCDNWQPPPSTSEADQWFQAYAGWQAVLNPPRIADGFSFRCAPGGWPLFVLDARSQREQRRPDNFDQAAITSETAMKALEDWLLEQARDKPKSPKFIASASVLLPLERDAEQTRWSSDGWAGYPASRARLLSFIVRHKIQNVVFLAGDAHLCMFSKTLLSMADDPLAIYSVVSSGLYAPWTFANAQPSDFVLDGDITLPEAGARAPKARITSFSARANGFALVQVKEIQPGKYMLSVEFDLQDGRRKLEQNLSVPQQPWIELPASP